MLQSKTKREDFDRYLHISYTQLNTYLKCPQKYEFQYVRGLPWEFIPEYFPFGRAIHEAAKLFYIDDELVFKMMNGTYWIQARYEYWYHYAYCPDAIVTEENGHFILTVVGRSIEVHPLTDVIESRIDGTFEGWQGESKYRLTDGQVWQQSAYKYQYKYAYRPEVIVYRSSGGYKMMVAGTNVKVRKIQQG